jgi:hypothetical protein
MLTQGGPTGRFCGWTGSESVPVWDFLEIIFHMSLGWLGLLPVFRSKCTSHILLKHEIYSEILNREIIRVLLFNPIRGHQ